MNKKLIINLLSVLLLSNTFFLFSESIFSDQPGSYVIYNDLRFNDQAFIGLLYLGDDTLLVRTYEENDQREFAIIMKLILDEGEVGFDDSMKIVAGGLKDSMTSQRVLPMMLNWANAWYENKEIIKTNHSHSAAYADSYSYNYWIPVFNIESIEDDPDFQLVTVGTVNNINDPAFAQFTGIPQATASESFRIMVGNDARYHHSYLNLTLDYNWIEGDDGVFRIQMKTVQDAALFREDINIEGTSFTDGFDLAKYLMLMNNGGILIADKSKIYEQDHAVFMENQVFDPNTNKLTFQRKKVIMKENLVTLISFASFLDLYTENQQYFDHLFE